MRRAARETSPCSSGCEDPGSKCPSLRDVTWTGKLPAAVSPDSMTQSVPSSTALATSVASARVGRGFLTIDSSIWVAVMTGFPTCTPPCQHGTPKTMSGTRATAWKQ